MARFRQKKPAGDGGLNDAMMLVERLVPLLITLAAVVSVAVQSDVDDAGYQKKAEQEQGHSCTAAFNARRSDVSTPATVDFARADERQAKDEKDGTEKQGEYFRECRDGENHAGNGDDDTDDDIWPGKVR